MIITRTPFRVSLFGGGTDYPSHYRKHGGAVLGFAIDRYCYLTVRRLPPFFAHRHRLVYSKVELVKSLDEIEHPTARAVLTELRDLIGDDGLEIHHDGDLPARSGLGSSSSFVVGLIQAVRSLYGWSIPSEALRREAIRIEREVAGEVVGDQDQTFAALGGLNYITFRQDGSIGCERLSPLDFRASRLMQSVLLVYTGISRVASMVARAQEVRVGTNYSALVRMRAIADEAWKVVLNDGPLPHLGALLRESWELKRSLSSLVSTAPIDEMHQAALSAGAYGGKLLGAGGGGFMAFLAEPEKHDAVVAAIAERSAAPAVRVPICVAPRGATVVLHEPNGL